MFLPPGADLTDRTRWPVALVPRWPLRRPDGSLIPETEAGCHDEEVEAWEAAASVNLPPESDLVPWFRRVGDRPPTYRGF